MSEKKTENELKTVTKPFYTMRNRPPKVVMCSNKPSKTMISPLDAQSPQEVLQNHGMYRDTSSLKSVEPFYADLTQFTEFSECLNSVRDVKEKFLNLDVDVRARFNHDPEQLCNYVMSKDFDITKIMNSDQLEAYNLKIEREKAEKATAEYEKSQAFKDMQKEQETYREFQRQQYEEWKKNFNTK